MLVTDAMPSVGATNKSFRLQGRPISVADNMCVDEQGRLAGSDIDMASAVRNAVNLLHLEPLDALKMASAYPAEFLGIADQMGHIAPGHRANFALLDDRLNVRTTWIDGRQEADR
jgi:N-acetylglucosamine-6-phosphate deacetylase